MDFKRFKSVVEHHLEMAKGDTEIFHLNQASAMLSGVMELCEPEIFVEEERMWILETKLDVMKRVADYIASHGDEL